METLQWFASAQGSQSFRVVLRIDNLNDTEIPVETIRMTARLAGQGIISGESMDFFEIPALGTQIVELRVTSDRISSPTRLLGLTQGPQQVLDYQLEGRLVVGGRPPRFLAFRFAGQVPFSVDF